jgi:hypothetical protein
MYLFAISTSHPQIYLVLFGLGLDVLGAVIIAIPDIQIISRYFHPGRLRRGLITLNNRESGYSGLGAPDSDGVAGVVRSDGFFEVIETMELLYDDKALDEGDDWGAVSSLMPITKTRSETDGNATGSTEREFVGFDEDNNRLITVDGITLLSSVRRRIEEMEGRFRRGGLFILVSGFLVQIFAQFP